MIIICERKQVNKCELVDQQILQRLKNDEDYYGDFGNQFLSATSSFHFTLQMRAKTDALAQIIRLLSDSDDSTIILSLDDISAFQTAYTLFAQVRCGLTVLTFTLLAQSTVMSLQRKSKNSSPLKIKTQDDM